VFKSGHSVPAFQKDLCFIDIETTGARIGYHEIIDIGVIRTCPAAVEIRGNWQRRIAPLFPERITDIARETNGFLVENWPSTPSSRSLWENFVDAVSGGIPVCHNPSFERAFISLAAAEQGVFELGLDHHWIGTESLAWPLVKGRSLAQFSLKSICQYFDIAPEPTPHSALGGADACLKVYKRFMEIYAPPPTARKTAT
jgi:DNA polymerase III epsilon subunit-like protein